MWLKHPAAFGGFSRCLRWRRSRLSGCHSAYFKNYWSKLFQTALDKNSHFTFDFILCHYVVVLICRSILRVFESVELTAVFLQNSCRSCPATGVLKMISVCICGRGHACVYIKSKSTHPSWWTPTSSLHRSLAPAETERVSLFWSLMSCSVDSESIKPSSTVSQITWGSVQVMLPVSACSAAQGCPPASQ